MGKREPNPGSLEKGCASTRPPDGSNHRTQIRVTHKACRAQGRETAMLCLIAYSRVQQNTCAGGMLSGS